jgi:hypothetical protein
MKPVTSQDMKWTRLQTTQGLKNQHAKLRGLGCLPTRSTQPKRYSRSSGQHDLSVQIQRLKRSLMAKVWLPKFWASTYLRFGHEEGPILIRELGDIAPEIPATQSVRNQNRFSFKADLETLSSFLRNEMNTKLEYNFVAHNLDTEFALFGVRTWEIWRRQGRTANQENLADFM